ncbi:MAG TPA: M23 family metallopeptidase, partial [Candidatus Omnitrophota bacterium]|nr:M23 family metallopeptidase [Candidatus Omnitrophota bacterium]
VRQGDKIGEVGKTGNANHRSIIPHLHFEIRRGNAPLDPM